MPWYYMEGGEEERLNCSEPDIQGIWGWGWNRTWPRKLWGKEPGQRQTWWHCDTKCISEEVGDAARGFSGVISSVAPTVPGIWIPVWSPVPSIWFPVWAPSCPWCKNTHISVHCAGLGNHPESGYLRVRDYTEVKYKTVGCGVWVPIGKTQQVKWNQLLWGPQSHWVRADTGFQSLGRGLLRGAVASFFSWPLAVLTYL